MPRFKFLVIILFSFLHLTTTDAARAQGIAPCGIPTQPSLLTPTGHAVLVPPSGQPLILFNPNFIEMVQMQTGQGGAMFRYLVQHECGHHVRGHVQAMHQNPAAAIWFNQKLELDADCYAAQQLASQNDVQAAQIAIRFWQMAGGFPTGPNYPTGFQRAAMIQQCFR